MRTITVCSPRPHRDPGRRVHSAGSSASRRRPRRPSAPRRRRLERRRRSPRPASPDACATDSLTTRRPPGKLDDRHGQPGLPAVLRRERRQAQRPPPWELGDPTNGKGFESAVAYAIADSSASPRTTSPGSSSRSRTRSRPAPRPSTSTSTRSSTSPSAPQTADLSDGYYFGNQALVVLKDSPLAKATIDRRAEGLRVRRPGRDDQLRHDRTRSSRRPKTARRLRHERRWRSRPSRQQDHRRRSSSTCRPPTTSRTSRSRTATIVGQFEGGTPGVLQRRPRQGQPADRLRQRGDRGADRRTARSTSWPAPGSRSRTRSRSSSRRRRRPRRGLGPMTPTVRARRRGPDPRARAFERRSRSSARSSSSAASAGSSSTPRAGRRSRHRSSTREVFWGVAARPRSTRSSSTSSCS